MKNNTINLRISKDEKAEKIAILSSDELKQLISLTIGKSLNEKLSAIQQTLSDHSKWMKETESHLIQIQFSVADLLSQTKSNNLQLLSNQELVDELTKRMENQQK